MNISRRKILTISTLLIALVGVVLSFIPFALSLQPNARADAALPRIDVSNISPGTYKLVTPENTFETFNGFKLSVYFLRTLNGHLYAWEVYARNGEVGMPDYHWWRTYYSCKEFGPDLQNGVIDERSLVHCHDKGLYPGQSEYWSWKLNGKAVSEYVDDMQVANGVIEGNYFVLGKKR